MFVFKSSLSIQTTFVFSSGCSYALIISVRVLIGAGHQRERRTAGYSTLFLQVHPLFDLVSFHHAAGSSNVSPSPRVVHALPDTSRAA